MRSQKLVASIFAAGTFLFMASSGIMAQNLDTRHMEHEKAAIVGINGAGKSTLLKIIMGEMSADNGDVFISKGATVGYLAQHQEINTFLTIFDVLLEVKKDILELSDKMRALEIKMKQADGEALYKITKDSNTKADFSDWKKLPIDKRIVEFYITKRYDHVSSEIRKLAEISEGYWKIVGKNPIEGEGMKGLYGNMKLYIYDSQHDLIYCYVFDS